MRLTAIDFRLSAGLALLATSASCVPVAGSAERIAPAAAPAAEAAAAKPADPRYEEARRIFWERLARQFEPVSGQPAAPFEGESMSSENRSRSLECLTSAIYHEARSESLDGQRAVAQVVLNRARHPAFPSTVCGVVFQGSERRTGCQFSFTCDGSLARRREPAAWSRAQDVAAAALAGSVFAPVGTATHYHTTAILPYWAPSLRRSAVVGSHIFYRWKGSAGEAAAFRQRHGGFEPVRASWSAAQDAQDDLPRIHRGAERKRTERVQLEDGAGTVNVHRGGAAALPAVAAAEEHGVHIHRGETPGTI